MRVKFRDLFDVRPDGTLHPKGNILVGGHMITTSMILRRSVPWNGVDFNFLIGKELEIEPVEDAFAIRKVY